MRRIFVISVLITLARALLAAGCGEALRLVLERMLPGVHPLVCLGVSVLAAVVLIELATALYWHSAGPDRTRG